jgi:hypothetical protein
LITLSSECEVSLSSYCTDRHLLRHEIFSMSSCSKQTVNACEKERSGTVVLFTDHSWFAGMRQADFTVESLLIHVCSKARCASDLDST